MVPSLARQSIIIKSGNDTSIILGNYECAYCLGILSKAAGIAENESYQDMQQWYEAVMSQLENFETDDKQLFQVLRMMRLYEPPSAIDEQMRELYHMGLEEDRMWQM